MSDAEYEVNNVVLTVSYRDVELDLERISSNLEGARYDPEVFPGVVYRASESGPSFLIFASGNMNCVGAKTVEGAERAIENLTEKLQAQGYDVDDPETRFRIWLLPSISIGVSNWKR